MHGNLRRVWSVVSWVLIVCVVVMAILLGGIRLIGYKPYAVLSGSMEPVYHVGSLIYVKQVPAEKIQVGDPITFRLQGDQIVGTHRVIAIDPASQHFTTKGDANNAPDAGPVPYQALIGVPVFCVPYLGYVSGVLTQPPTMYLAWSALAILLLLSFLPDLLAAAHRADKAAEEKAPKTTGKSRKA